MLHTHAHCDTAPATAIMARMVELQPAPFADLVDRMFLELERQGSIFDLPRRRWYVPSPGGPDLSVQFHGHTAATPVGPASGPHTQMAQNLVLSWLAGARILELKTVQINDRLTIPRPCIDATNVCYNIEWSQELRISDSLREYVAGAMLIRMLRVSDVMGDVDLEGWPGETIFDLSVGYDLEGIRSRPICDFIAQMRDASGIIDTLRLQIPSRHRQFRDLLYPTRLCNSVTLSTFHGCPADEIERICAFLLSDLGMDVVVKMNPPMLGRERLEHLLHDVLGYTEIRVSPGAWESGIAFDEAVAMCRRLRRMAGNHGRSFGAKFSNTLEVVNHRGFFKPGSPVMYLSGQPLHVLALTLADLFRQAIGPELPITFSAGVDRHNFAGTVACGFCPVTTCTDLLRPGGYARLPAYLGDLSQQMRRVGARTIADFILDARGQRASCGGEVARAAAANMAIVAEEARNEDRYRAPNNRSVPRRIGTHLMLFDCVSCDKCIPVCPNDANFIYELPIPALTFHDWLVQEGGGIVPGPERFLKVERQHQIANFADFCNECGNCDTFCPEYGGPFIAKPVFYGSLEGWRAAAPRDGFQVAVGPLGRRIYGRMQGREYLLQHDSRRGVYVYEDGVARTVLPQEIASAPALPPVEVSAPPGHAIDMHAFHTLRLLLSGILDPRRVHQVNARYVEDL